MVSILWAVLEPNLIKPSYWVGHIPFFGFFGMKWKCCSQYLMRGSPSQGLRWSGFWETAEKNSFCKFSQKSKMAVFYMCIIVGPSRFLWYNISKHISKQTNKQNCLLPASSRARKKLFTALYGPGSLLLRWSVSLNGTLTPIGQASFHGWQQR